MFKKILIICLSIFMSTCFMYSKVSAATEGQCGDNVYWSIYDGVLTISGEGDMYDYTEENSIWYANDMHFSVDSIVIEEGVESIGDYAFLRMYFLKSVTIPSTVTSIGNHAFEHCRELVNITIPNSVTSIGNHAFDSCYALPSIEMSDYITNIGEGAFYDCRALENVILPSNIDIINDRVFDNCTSLTSIDIPDSVISIGDSAFACTSLTNVTLPDSITNIEDNAFIVCRDLTNINIPNNVTNIGAYAFKYCDSLTSINIPESVISIGECAFNECKSLKSIVVDLNNKYYKSDDQGVLYNKDMTTLIVCPGGFEGPNYTIHDGVKFIEDYAFYYCDSLVSVTMPDSVIDMGECVFQFCYSLSNVKLSNNLTKLGNNAFYLCSALKDVKIPKSVESIGESAFIGCQSLKSIKIPEGIKNIGKRSFFGLQDISIFFKGDAPEIAYDAFAYTKGKAYYPKENLAWTSVASKEYKDSKIEWIEYNPLCPFTDVYKGQWYYDSVCEAYDLGLMTGATETLFKPTVSMNRGMVAIVLHRMEGAEEVAYAPIFPDVYDNQYFTTAVLWAKQTGIINGYNNGTFMPLKNVTREEMATMIQRFAKYKGLDVASSKDITYFKDYAEISTYAKAPIQWCVENGVLSGKFEGTKVDPLGTATRAECAKMLVQAYKVIYK